MNENTIKNSLSLERATLGGGCFWCLEAVYQQISGVSAVVSGYAGGAMLNPDYESICSGTTGHAEIIDVYFDPQTVSFRDLLEIFFVTVKTSSKGPLKLELIHLSIVSLQSLCP